MSEGDSRFKDPYLMDSNKLLWHMDRVMAYERGECVPPILIDVGATKICNICCTYCYGIYQKFSPKTVIPPKILVRLFHDASRLGVKALTLTGDGEPTLNPGMYEACKAGKAGGLDIGLATNGIALSDSKIKTILDTCVWTRINISASNPKSYTRVHGVDYFQKVIANTRKFVKLRGVLGSLMTIGYQMVLVPECLENAIPLAKIAVDLGIDYFVIKQFSDPGGNIPSRGYNQDEFVKKATPILRKAEELTTEKTKIIPKWSLINRKNVRAYPYCIDLPFILQISGNSRCYPCGYLFNRKEYCYGDLKKQTLVDIITSEHYWNTIDKISKTHTSKLCPTGCCRHDATNLWLTNYRNRPKHINFI